ncbi:involucrin repeat protein [Histoplasma ohiense]|nr:involucrin repeat protein [Histoplasma ohiense (nom. inval.)]
MVTTIPRHAVEDGLLVPAEEPLRLQFRTRAMEALGQNSPGVVLCLKFNLILQRSRRIKSASSCGMRRKRKLDGVQWNYMCWRRKKGWIGRTTIVVWNGNRAVSVTASVRMWIGNLVNRLQAVDVAM